MAQSKKQAEVTSRAAIELGRRGGLKGGRARAAAMTPAERKATAQLAAQSRWDVERGVQRAICAGSFPVGSMDLECAVLPGPIRVLSQRAIMKALSRYRPGGRGATEGGETDAMPRFVAAKNLQPFISDDLRRALLEPILYRAPGSKGNGQPAQGIRAELLAEICEVYLDAEKANVLKPQQANAAKSAEVLHRALAKTGIIALVDEATGFQYDRARNALAEILEAFIGKELAKWVKTFSDDFYKELFRLRNKKADDIKRRPPYFGKLTNDIVYSRLAPGVLAELKQKNPVTGSGTRKVRHHQWLTADIGNPRLREHLAQVTALMKISADWSTFIAHLDQVAPKVGDVEGSTDGAAPALDGGTE
jgi:hypothetical protein